MAATEVNTQMNWDLTSFFPGFNAPEMSQFKEALQADISSLCQKLSGLQDLSAGNQAEWEKVFLRGEDILARFSHLRAYVGCLSAVDAHNEAYLAENATMDRIGAEVSKLKVEMLRGLKQTSDRVFADFASRTALSDASYYLSRLRRESRLTMSAEKELLAADLGVDGIDSWGRLYDTVSGKLEFEMDYPDGRRDRLPVSQRRSLMDNPDRRIRRAAFRGGNAAWATIESVAAAALNAISGARLTLCKHRGIDHFLEVALFQSAITRKTLDAMFQAVFAEIHVPRRLLRAKARAMGSETLAWYDMTAPLDLPDEKGPSWQEGKTTVQAAFRDAYPGLGRFLRDMFDRNWFEWEPRKGKRPGGFCTTSLLTGESRVFMTYNNTLGDVATLAHEVGHAFHSHAMRDLRPFSRLYPMTLAESASTFGEMILADGVLGDASISLAHKALLLDMQIGHASIYLLDIPVRFEFEKALYEERAGGELSLTRLKELMVETQQRVLGEVLEEGGEDPYFWASKLHFYITRTMFYNFPYTFGFLLSRGLYATFKRQGPDFLPRYEEFLRLTGSDTPANIARRTIGRDLESPEFWAEAIRSLEEPLRQLQAILPSVLPSSPALSQIEQ